MEATENGAVLSVDSESELPVDVNKVENGDVTPDVEDTQLIDVISEQNVCEYTEKDAETASESDIAKVTVDNATQVASVDVQDESEELRLKLSELERECSNLRSKNDTLQRNYDDALSEICVAGCVKESLVELERQNASRIDEVATLQHLLNESSEENRWDWTLSQSWVDFLKVGRKAQIIEIAL